MCVHAIGDNAKIRSIIIINEEWKTFNCSASLEPVGIVGNVTTIVKVTTDLNFDGVKIHSKLSF